MIPAKKYPGRKGGAGVYQQILSELPKCELFIECMAGSGFLSSLLTCPVLLNDVNPKVFDNITISDRVQVSHESYDKVINRFDDGSSTRVFYFDPPYLMTTRRSKHPIYTYEWNDSDHIRFLEIVNTVKCPVIISHYPCTLYDKALKSWRKKEFPAMTRGGVSVEAIYMNYPYPVLLQCPEMIGSNFTDRQRIKRKVLRTIDKLKRESPSERAAILTQIIREFEYLNIL